MCPYGWMGAWMDGMDTVYTTFSITLGINPRIWEAIGVGILR